MATRDQMASAIEPGSMAYGERDDFEASLPQSSGGGVAMSAAPEGTPPLEVESALGMLTNGTIPSNPTIPQTAGLPAGPGPGPAGPEDPIAGTYTERLRDIAVNGKSPHLRARARAALKVLYMRQRR